MSRTRISDRLRRQVESESGYRCGYCRAQQDVVGQVFHVEHIVPRVAGGTTTIDNLCLACALCNVSKGRQTRAVDPSSGRTAPLFHPRIQRWQRHFQWSKDGMRIIGKTACGRATVVALRLNHPIALRARQKWTEAGWWPPED